MIDSYAPIVLERLPKVIPKCEVSYFAHVQRPERIRIAQTQDRTISGSRLRLKQTNDRDSLSTPMRSGSARLLRFGLKGYIQASAIRQCYGPTIDIGKIVLNPNFSKQVVRLTY